MKVGGPGVNMQESEKKKLFPCNLGGFQ